MGWIDWVKNYVRDDRFDLPSHPPDIIETNKHREVVIARVMETGIPCYPVSSGPTLSCELCDSGPCRGPIEKYKKP